MLLWPAWDGSFEFHLEQLFADELKLCHFCNLLSCQLNVNKRFDIRLVCCNICLNQLKKEVHLGLNRLFDWFEFRLNNLYLALKRSLFLPGQAPLEVRRLPEINLFTFQPDLWLIFLHRKVSIKFAYPLASERNRNFASGLIDLGNGLLLVLLDFFVSLGLLHGLVLLS